MTTIELLIELLAGEDSLLRVDDDDELAAVNVRGVLRSVLTSEDGRCENRSLAERLACRVDHVPFALEGFLLSHVCGHS